MSLLKNPLTLRFMKSIGKGRRWLSFSVFSYGIALCWLGVSINSATENKLPGSASENSDSERYSPGERYASTYEINMLRCIFCGFCEDACPTEAIVLGHNYELTFTSRREAIYTKEMLIVPVPENGKATPMEVASGAFDKSIPIMLDPV